MFETRIASIQNELAEFEIDGFLITSSYNIAYLTGIFAFSLEEREARILITKQNVYLFTDARYTEMVKVKSPFVTLVEIAGDSPFLKLILPILAKEKVTQLGFEENNISYKEASDLEEKLTTIDLVPVEDIVENFRAVKDNEEIEKIRKACALTDLAFDFILHHIKPGVTELEVKTQLENFIRLQGGGIGFESIVAFGKNSAIPHHQSGNLKLQTENVILLDFGAKLDGYGSDMTRVVFIGKPTDKMRNIYEVTCEAQDIANEYLATHMKKGFETKRVHELANSHIKSMGFPKIPHAIGHGVGIQVHENPVISPFTEELLIPGMVITNEPGIYIAGTGGVRIEDTLLVTTKGIESLTKSTRKLIVL